MDLMVTRRVTPPYIFAWMTYVAPGASKGVRYVPATTADVMLVVPREYVTIQERVAAPVALTLNLSAPGPAFRIEMSNVKYVPASMLVPKGGQMVVWPAPLAL